MGALRAAAVALEFGFIVGGLMVAGLFGGRWMDERLQTSPAFLLAGLLLGLAGSVYLLYVIARLQTRKS